MKKRLLGLLSCSILFFTNYSCQKEDLTAYKGQAGAQGTMGEQGDDGKGYNLIIEEFTLEQDDWIDAYNAVYSIPELTQAYLDSGIIMTYYKEDSAWVPLPYELSRHIFMEAMYKPGEIRIFYKHSPSQIPYWTLDYKLVAAIDFPGDKQALAKYVEVIVGKDFQQID